MFSKSTYINRRNRLKKEVGSGVLLFLGNDESAMNYADNTYHFRQDSTFLYFFGSDYAGLNAVIDIDENREIIFGDELTIDDIVWMGTQPSIHDKSEVVGISDTEPTSALKPYLQNALAKGRKVHFLPPYRGEHKVKILNWLGIAPEAQAAAGSVDFVRAVVAQRNIKTDEEIVEIENAVDTSVKMHVAAIKSVRPGMKEYEVAAAMYYAALNDGDELSFPIICTINGQTLHNHIHANTVKDGQLLLVDAGAENGMHYCGDLSSTCPVGKKFTEQQKAIYEIQLAAHQAAVKALKPGVPFKEIHLLAGATILEGLKGLGMVKGDPKEGAAAGAHALFFPCGLGHMMGMDVHDMENLGEVWVGYDGVPKSTVFGLKSLRLAQPLKPGFVLTIEPGVYFIPELIDMWAAEKRFAEFINYDEVKKFKSFSGIRNEEDYLITADGARRLGHLVKPMSVEEVEALR